MDAGIREWIMGYTCGVCHAEVGSTRQAGVLVLARDAEDKRFSDSATSTPLSMSSDGVKIERRQPRFVCLYTNSSMRDQ
jgi:hypothetical protein